MNRGALTKAAASVMITSHAGRGKVNQATKLT